MANSRIARWLSALCPAALVLATFIYASFKWSKAYFGRHLDAEAIYFTLTLPTEGADMGVLLSYLKFVALPMLAAVALAYGCRRLMARLAAGAPSPRRRAAYALVAVATLAYFLGSLYYLEHRNKLISFLMAPRDYTQMFEERYAPLAAGEVAFPHKRNVVLLMMESAEETYNDAALFGEPLMPALAQLRAGNASFRGFRDTRGANWTVGALVAFTTGLPMAFSQESTLSNYFGDKARAFLPGASSLLDIVARNGYDVSFFLGSDRGFAGQGTLFATHALGAAIYDLGYFEQKRLAGEIDYQRSNWGAPDSLVYEAAKEYLSHRDQGKPFFLIMETVDTHFPAGRFEGLIPQKYGDMRDAIAEADRLAAGFVAWLQAQPFYGDTSVVIVGDHLFMREKVGPVKLPPVAGREPYDVFINTGFPDGEVKRDFAAFDLAPTILQAAGAVWPGGRLGLGVSLFQEGGQTLFETQGQDYYEAEVRKKSALYNSLLAGF